MENSNERFENEWKKAFNNAEEEPNSSLWQNLENKLAEKEILIYKQKYFYLLRVAAALLILLIPLTIFFVYESGLKNDDVVINKRTSDISLNNNLPLTHKSTEVKSDKIESTKHTAPDSKALFNEKSKENNSEAKDSPTPDILQNQSIKHSHKIKNHVAVTSKDSPYEISPNKNPEKIKSDESIALYSGNSKVSSDLLQQSEVKKNKLNLLSKSTIGDDAPNNLESRKLMYPINEDEAKDEIVNPKEISKESKSLSYSQGIYKSSSPQEDKNLMEQNLIENSVNNRNSAFSIDYLNGKGPDLNDTHGPLSTPELGKIELAREVVPQKDRMRRWFATVDFTPTYINQNFERPSTTGNTNAVFQSSFNNSNLAMDVVNQLDVLIKPDFSFNSGLGVGYRLNKRLYIESGVKYTYNQSIVMTNLFYTNKDNSTKTLVFNKVLKNEPAENPLSMESLVDAKYSTYNQVANSAGITQISTINIYTQYLTVPLTLNYKVIDRKFNLSLGGGLATDFFLQYRSKEDKKNNVEKEKIKYYDNSIFRKIAFSLLLNAELEYEISNKYGIYLRPVYKGSLHSYTDRDKLKNRPNSTGVSFGIRYNFK